MTNKTLKVRWNGAKDDPEQITQYGVTFKKGEFTDVPVPAKGDTSTAAMTAHKHIAKFKGNPWFEVKGDDNDVEPSDGSATAATAGAGATQTAPVHVSAKTFSVEVEGTGASKSIRIVETDAEGRKTYATEDEYADVESAQTVADAMNKVAP